MLLKPAAVERLSSKLRETPATWQSTGWHAEYTVPAPKAQAVCQKNKIMVTAYFIYATISLCNPFYYFPDVLLIGCVFR